MVSIHVLATPISGLARSSLVKPIALNMERAPDRSRPSVISRLRCLGSIGLKDYDRARERESWMNIALGRTKHMLLRDARELICENVHSHMPDTYILGIESSCDETAAAVVRSGEEVISNVVASQTATHSPYGGVVPELASREHLRTIVPVVRKALADAGQSYGSIDALAVTQGPGLAGSLLVGISFAKALAFALDKPLIAVNHLEGHIHAVLLEERQKGNRELMFPVLALVVSAR